MAPVPRGLALAVLAVCGATAAVSPPACNALAIDFASAAGAALPAPCGICDGGTTAGVLACWAPLLADHLTLVGPAESLPASGRCFIEVHSDVQLVASWAAAAGAGVQCAVRVVVAPTVPVPAETGDVSQQQQQRQPQHPFVACTLADLHATAPQAIMFNESSPLLAAHMAHSVSLCRDSRHDHNHHDHDHGHAHHGHAHHDHAHHDHAHHDHAHHDHAGHDHHHGPLDARTLLQEASEQSHAAFTKTFSAHLRVFVYAGSSGTAGGADAAAVTTLPHGLGAVVAAIGAAASRKAVSAASSGASTPAPSQRLPVVVAVADVDTLSRPQDVRAPVHVVAPSGKHFDLMPEACPGGAIAAPCVAALLAAVEAGTADGYDLATPTPKPSRLSAAAPSSCPASQPTCTGGGGAVEAAEKPEVPSHPRMADVVGEAQLAQLADGSRWGVCTRVAIEAVLGAAALLMLVLLVGDGDGAGDGDACMLLRLDVSLCC
jgi:hypothetical protein